MAKESQTSRNSTGRSSTSDRTDRTDRSVSASSREDEFSSASRSGGGNSSLQQMESGSERKSIGAIISQSLAEESQEGIDRLLNEVKTYFESGREYIKENPREAAGLAVAAGICAWALLGTRPGRAIFESGAAKGVPFVTRWIRQNMGAVSH